MRLSQLYNKSVLELLQIYSQNEAMSIVRRLLNDKYLVSNIDLIVRGESEVGFEAEFWDDLKKLMLYMPIQYVVGYETFCDLKFEVNQATLIPRPETQQLVEIVCGIIGDKTMKILDIGTGSGAIAISIAKKCRNAIVSALDISSDAIDVAKRNAVFNHVTVNFIHRDIFSPPSEIENFDIIVSNPPYVLNSQRNVISRNVLDYEPDSALFVDDNDPLLFYREITKFANTHLNSGGELFFEINRAFGKQICEMIKQFNFMDVKLLSDFNDNDRFVWTTKS